MDANYSWIQSKQAKPKSPPIAQQEVVQPDELSSIQPCLLFQQEEASPNHGNSRQRKKQIIQQTIIQNPTLLKCVHSDNEGLNVNKQLINQKMCCIKLCNVNCLVKQNMLRDLQGSGLLANSTTGLDGNIFCAQVREPACSKFKHIKTIISPFHTSVGNIFLTHTFTEIMYL